MNPDFPGTGTKVGYFVLFLSSLAASLLHKKEALLSLEL